MHVSKCVYVCKTAYNKTINKYTANTRLKITSDRNFRTV